jgi:hypothetical protein
MTGRTPFYDHWPRWSDEPAGGGIAAVADVFVEAEVAKVRPNLRTKASFLTSSARPTGLQIPTQWVWDFPPCGIVIKPTNARVDPESPVGAANYPAS